MICLTSCVHSAGLGVRFIAASRMRHLAKIAGDAEWPMSHAALSPRAPKGRQAAQSTVVPICRASLSDPAVTSSTASPSMPFSHRYAGYGPCCAASRRAVRKGFIGPPRMNFLNGRIAATERGIALDRIGTIRSEVAALGLAPQVPGQVPPRRGERIALNLPPEHVHVFDAEEKALPQRRPAPASVAGPAP